MTVEKPEARGSSTAEQVVRAGIRAALAAARVTQVSLATRLGLSQKHVSNVLNGQAGLSFGLAERMLAVVDRRLEVAIAEQVENFSCNCARVAVDPQPKED